MNEGYPFIDRENAWQQPVLIVPELGPWQLFAGKQPDSIDFDSVFMQGEGAGRFALPYEPGVRLYYGFRSAPLQTVLAEQHLPTQGAYNIRDLGGLRTQDGSMVAWGKLFRSDDLMNLTPTDLAYLAGIPLVTAIDFRTQNEISWAPDKLPDTVRHHYYYHIVPGGVDKDISERQLQQEGGASAFMRHIYCQLVVDKNIIDTYRKFFKRILEQDKQPLLFHCSAGKDRTGWAAALFYFALGVHTDDIFEDYMLSATYIEGKYPAGNERFTVKPSYLNAALSQVKESFGSMDKYLSEVLKIDLKKLRSMFLQ